MASRPVYEKVMSDGRECHVVEWEGDVERKPRIVREVVVFDYSGAPEALVRAAFHAPGNELPDLSDLRLPADVRREVEARLRGSGPTSGAR